MNVTCCSNTSPTFQHQIGVIEAGSDQLKALIKSHTYRSGFYEPRRFWISMDYHFSRFAFGATI